MKQELELAETFFFSHVSPCLHGCPSRDREKCVQLSLTELPENLESRLEPTTVPLSILTHRKILDTHWLSYSTLNMYSVFMSLSSEVVLRMTDTGQEGPAYRVNSHTTLESDLKYVLAPHSSFVACYLSMLGFGVDKWDFFFSVIVSGCCVLMQEIHTFLSFHPVLFLKPACPSLSLLP